MADNNTWKFVSMGKAAISVFSTQERKFSFENPKVLNFCYKMGNQSARCIKNAYSNSAFVQQIMKVEISRDAPRKKTWGKQVLVNIIRTHNVVILTTQTLF